MIDKAIAHVDRRLSENDIASAVADILADRTAYERSRDGETAPPITRMRLRSYDPRNVLIEREHRAEQELSTLQETKCVRYLWECFDCVTASKSNGVTTSIWATTPSFTTTCSPTTAEN